MESQSTTVPIQIYIESRIDQRAGITAKHMCCTKIMKAVRRERALAGTAFICFLQGNQRGLAWKDAQRGRVKEWLADSTNSRKIWYYET